jgi:dolichyl-phosphate-mannose-protein mannosyltransferase
MIYLSFFWVHFKILKYSGPGDSFMSPAFQETLQGNELLLNAQGEQTRRPMAHRLTVS